MRARIWLVGPVLFVVGLLVGAVAPSTRAQAATDSCTAPWRLEVRPRTDGTAFFVAKINRCTGDVVVLTDATEKGNAHLASADRNPSLAWLRYPEAAIQPEKK